MLAAPYHTVSPFWNTLENCRANMNIAERARSFVLIAIYFGFNYLPDCVGFTFWALFPAALFV